MLAINKTFLEKVHFVPFYDVSSQLQHVTSYLCFIFLLIYLFLREPVSLWQPLMGKAEREGGFIYFNCAIFFKSVRFCLPADSVMAISALKSFLVYNILPQQFCSIFHMHSNE